MKEQKEMPIYDETAGYIKTPDGLGKYIGFDPSTGKATVEMDYSHLVEYDGKDCFI